LENLANRLGVGKQRVARKFQAFDRALSSFFVAGAARVSHKHRNVPEVGAVTRCRFDSNLGRYADNDKGVYTAISQSEIEPRAFEGRHRQFVEYAFGRSRRQLRNNLEGRIVAQKPWFNLFGRVGSLPGHSHPELRHAH